MPTDVYVEAAPKRTFAYATEWPGWCRSSKDETGALDALFRYAERYEPVAIRAGLRFPKRIGPARVVERVRGGATTEFGAPEKTIGLDLEPMTERVRSSHVALLESAWVFFDETVATSPAVLRKGPRGGGRDRDAIAEHVTSAELAYARKLGVRLKASYAQRSTVEELRSAVVDVVTASGDATDPGPPVEKGWPIRYAVRRIAWHVLDHAWEMEDRSR